MPFEIPKSQASIAQNRFEFTFPSSKKKYSLPLLKFIKPSLVRDLGTLDEIDGFCKILDAYYPDDDLLDKFEDADQFEAFLTAWKDESGVSLGESEDSTDS